MKIAVLEHKHGHGTDIHVAMVDDRATLDDSDAIIAGMVKLYGIDYEPGTDEQVTAGDGESMDLRLLTRDQIKTVNLDFPVKPREKELRRKKSSVF